MKTTKITTICPFINRKGDCTHKIPFKKRTKGKLPICIYKNKKRCRMYNEWKKARNGSVEPENTLDKYLYSGVKDE